MAKNKKKVSRELGRDEEIKAEELARRYAAIMRFLQDNWGRIGQKLTRVHNADDVKSVLTLVRDAKWMPAFRDFPTKCLLGDAAAETTWRELRKTRQRYEVAKSEEGRLSHESQRAREASQSAKIAMEAFEAEHRDELKSRKIQRRFNEISSQLRLDELTKKANDATASWTAAQKNRELLENNLQAQETFVARNEVLGFVLDPEKRYAKTPVHFAKAMAGLPFYDWLYSIRKCSSIPELAKVPPTYWFQVFEMLRTIVKRTKPTNLRKIELKLKRELLKDDTDPQLKAYISPQWHYITLAFADCRGKGFRPEDLPYRIMEKFLDHFEGPSVADFEMAKHNQLLQ